MISNVTSVDNAIDSDGLLERLAAAYHEVENMLWVKEGKLLSVAMEMWKEEKKDLTFIYKSYIFRPL